ncbi:hypothetical protein STENM327S_08353 [Streptomyces tendae]
MGPHLRHVCDPATWRDVLWLPVDMTAGFVSALLAFALALYPLEGLVIAAGLWRVLPDGYWYGFVKVTDQTSALYAAALGAVLLLAAYRLTPLLLRAHFRLTGALLGSGQGELAERVRVLTETRRVAVRHSPPNCAASSATCTTGHRPGWSPSAWTWAPSRRCWRRTR